MLTLGEYIRLYFKIEAQYIKGQMQYRADFLISSIGIGKTMVEFWFEPMSSRVCM